ncbi:MAG: DNA polymerase III subunit alpha [Patescibacteria group bacterium]
MEFVHLHTHSHYSLLDGLAKIPDLLDKAKSLDMKALALTDHGNMYGSVEFFQESEAREIKPIVGQEFYLAPQGRFEKNPRGQTSPYHLILLAKNKVGYQNLIKLTTAAHLEGFYYKPRIDFELLTKHHDGLIALTACLRGEIPSLILSGKIERAEESALRYQELFGKDNFYLELQYHPGLPQQDLVNANLIDISKKHQIPLVATNDIHYLNPEDANAQDVLVCIQTKRKVEEENRLTMVGVDYSLLDQKQMQEAAKDVPEAIANTNKIAEMVDYRMEFGRTLLPHFETPKGKDYNQYIEELCFLGAERRGIELKGEMKKKLDYELSIIKKTGFASYFLIVQDFVNWAKSNGIVVGPGRGSAAGSVVSYLLNITNIDPIKYELIFERFLNPERISLPDIDLDFADRRRDEVIRYVESKYGHDHVAQIITFGTMAARAAIRDVGRVLDIAYSYCDRVAKLIPMFMNLETAIKTVPELKEIYEGDPEGKKLLDTAKKIEGCARHASTHACGVVITKDPLDEYVPVQFATTQGEKIKVTQYSLHPIEDLGILKMDFLGLKNLTIIEDTINIVKKTRDVDIHVEEIPLDDRKTFNLLKKAQTTGVFQLESSGMRRYLRELKPTEIEDIIAMVALYRPGPMEWIKDYIAGKHGLQETVYLHPTLKPILEKTYGVAIYQEQVLQIARDLAGFTLGEADVLRKAVGKKIAKLLREQKQKFIQGCIKNGVSKSVAEKVFNFIEPFAGYGFNRAHAACYARIAYETAYLKANFPAEFMASLMTADYHDTDRIALEVDECQQMGIEVMPPDINESFSTFTVVKASLAQDQKTRIRFGLKAIKNLGFNIVQSIIDERKAKGHFKNIEDFLSRVQTKDLNKKSLESLIKSGALEVFGERNLLLSNIDKLLTFSKAADKESKNGQTNIFKILPTTAAPKLRLEKAEPAPKKQRLLWEKEFVGLYISEHPLAEYAEYLNKTATPLNSIEGTYINRRVKVGGIITQIKKIITRSSEPMLFVRIEDTSGRIEVLVFPSILKNNPTIWQEDKVVLINGKLSDKDGELKILCETVKPVDLDKLKDFESVVQVTVPSSTPKTIFDRLKNIFQNHPGQYPANLKIFNAGSSRIIRTNFTVDFNDNIKKDIENLVGPNTIDLIDKPL